MRAGISWLVSAMIVFAGPASADGELAALLLQDHARYNRLCRGGAGDSSNTFIACGARDYAGWLLNGLGWCLGREGEAGFEMSWHLCEASSSNYPKPLSSL
jgi:hypothetical protein